MTGGRQDQAPTPGQPTAGGTEGTAGAQWPASWYPDPWLPGGRRYWNGQTWTGEVAASPTDANQGWAWSQGGAGGQWQGGGPGQAGSQWQGGGPGQAGSQWQGGGPGAGGQWQGGSPWPAAGPGGATVSSWSGFEGAGQPPVAPRGRRRGLWWGAVGIVAVLVAVVAIVAVAAGSRSKAHSTAGGLAPATGGASGAAPTGPNQRLLAQLVVQPGDAPSGDAVQLIPGGDQVAGQPTLDLCNGTFPSESLRASRRQTSMADTQGQVVLSTEAVLYQNAAATAQAFSELRATAAACPPTSVPSPVGEPAVTTTFNPRPDASWPQTPTVERLAYDFVATDGQGVTQDSIAVYLRRGSVLMGLYFPTPGAPPAIDGQSSIAATVGLFAARMAKLPASVVDGTRPSAGPSTPTGPTTPGTQSLPGPSVN